MMRIISVAFSPASFAFPYCLSTLFFVTSVGFVRGMKTHLAGFFKRDKVMFSGLYLISTVITLLMAWWKVPYVLMMIVVVLQFVTLAWFLISFVPGGTNASRLAVTSFLGRF